MIIKLFSETKSISINS